MSSAVPGRLRALAQAGYRGDNFLEKAASRILRRGKCRTAKALTWRSTALLHHKTVASFSTPACRISTPNSLPARVSSLRPCGAHCDAAHPFHSPALSAPLTSAQLTAPRCAPRPPLDVASNHLNASMLILTNLSTQSVARRRTDCTAAHRKQIRYTV